MAVEVPLLRYCISAMKDPDAVLLIAIDSLRSMHDHRSDLERTSAATLTGDCKLTVYQTLELVGL